MDDKISVDLTIHELELIIKSLEEFSRDRTYVKYTREAKDEFDNLIKKLKES
jgi:hypothetical protein